MERIGHKIENTNKGVKLSRKKIKIKNAEFRLNKPLIIRSIKSRFSWYGCYYPHRSRDSLSPVCGIFFRDEVLCFSVFGF